MSIKLSDARKFTIEEVKKYIGETVEQIKYWEKNLKEWKEILALLQDNPASQDKE